MKIADFNAVKASQGISVVLTQKGNTHEADISVDQELEPYIKVEVKDGTLKCYFESNNVIHNNGVKAIVRVSSPTLTKVDLSSAATLALSDNFNVDGRLKLDMSSASGFKAKNLTCSSLDVEVSSASHIRISELNASVDIDASSASSVNIDNLTGSLDVSASSSASVKVKGMRGKEIEADASSTATITVENLKCDEIDADASSMSSISLSGVCSRLKKDSSSGARIKTKNLIVKNRYNKVETV
ncbi:MAG: DUF2807 domain-containing protein [Bacteroidales bacterium]|nr:DUF2807 domain-containing protein [Bacteroidales bacterium]